MKAQAALEFLTTYIWALMAILLTIGALYYFGIFDFGKLARQQCLFNSQFECIDFAFEGSEIRIRLLNNLGEDIQVESVQASNDGTLNCISPAPFSWPSGNQTDILFTGCTGGGFIAGERAHALISLSYYAPATPSQPRHTVKGTIDAHVT